jgi:trehalose 6-phosphate synthase
MRGAITFVAALVAGLALVTWLAGALVQRTTHVWFERDLALRAQLAVTGARQALVAHWRKTDRGDLRELLGEITRDERILATAACSVEGALLARSVDLPESITCGELVHRLPPLARPDDRAWRNFGERRPASGGDVHVSAVPLLDQGDVLGFVVLVHDLSFVGRREAQSRRFLLVAFGVLAVAASIVTALAARVAWRSWTEELRRTLRGDGGRPEFQPILRDVRALIAQLGDERRTEAEAQAWTPQRLKATLERHLQGERVVIVANREPYIHERRGDQIAVLHPASGLVTALEPVLRACSGVWIAHGAGSADRETADARSTGPRAGSGEAPRSSSSTRRVWLTPEEERGYYYGFANEGLWPLCHISDTRPAFRREDWEHYRTVNARFADAVCDEVDVDDPIVLVQDYHFALAPRLIRERLPRATVITFWHIPWPNSQRWGICPWRKELLDGLLGSSIVGFHTQFDCNNFTDAVDAFLEARIDREEQAVVQQGRRTLVRPYPISLEWPSRWAEGADDAAACRAAVFAELRLRPDALLGVGVDRLDYTKGVEERLLAVERLLERFPALRGRFTFAQLAAPSRTAIERYRQLNVSVETLAERINARFGHDGYRPIALLKAHHEPPAIFRYYRAADLCYVSSLHDGMNLVAKEFVAAREDEAGVLVLSQFTGAARELTEALIVNPYDLEAASGALYAALTMSLDEQRERMRAMRTLISSFNVYRWAGRMLADAARLRSRDRLTGRLADSTGSWKRT